MTKGRINSGTVNKKTLTGRELEVLQLFAKGMNRNEIATKLFVSPETVKKHVQNIYQKLKAKNKIDALNKMKWL